MSPSADIIPIGSMNEADYDKERARIRELYGESNAEAAAKRDQAMAVLFKKSEWTQERLAKKEGKSRQWIDQRLRFGGFLNFATIVAKSESVPKDLTESNFRNNYWGKTEKANGDPDERFRMIIEMMQEQEKAPATPDGNGRKNKRPGIVPDLFAKFSDGKWRPAETMAQRLNADIDQVNTALETKRALRENRKVEKKQVGTQTQYRIFKLDKAISSDEIVEKLTPILKGLQVESKKEQIMISVVTLAVLANDLAKLLKEWTE